ncbi:MAG: Fe-S protein assembly chaperone HscA [Alphaproteobacteria bacterium]|nr:Fe-S protein assembly chaperone HscA [Alphaproteobacteria bacterium]
MVLLDIHEPGETPVPHAATEAAVGIDLGTTNSLVAYAVDGKPEVLRNIHGEGLVPSVVAYLDDGILVGYPAKERQFDASDRVVSSIKRLMGRGIEDVKKIAGTLPYTIEPGSEGMVRLAIAGRRVSPVEVSAEILKTLKSRAEKRLEKSVARAVITVPAYFDDAARTATKDAARLAGLHVLRLVNEPTAAALAYGLDKGVEGLYAIYDLGGGTFDVSILRLEKGVFQVLATGGHAALGGDDFDHLIAERFLAERGETKPSLTLVKSALNAARTAKERLSTDHEGRWDIDAAGRLSTHNFDRVALETLIEPLIEHTIDIARHVIEDAKLAANEIKGVVLVGGATRMPIVRRMVAGLFGREPLSDIDPDEVVALGAALQAEALTSGSNTLLLDVTPLSLGLETMGGVVERVIERNTPIPVAHAQEFTTYQDGQTAMLIHVVQGEREMVDQCRSLARFVLRGIPSLVAGAARIKVTFALDADGILTVSAREELTGIEQRVEVRPSYGLAPEDMEAMLRSAMEHAREDVETRLLTESRVEGQRGLLALKSALRADGEILTPIERRTIENAMAGMERALSSTDRDMIEGWIEKLDAETLFFAERRMDRGMKTALEGLAIESLESKLQAAATTGSADAR